MFHTSNKAFLIWLKTMNFAYASPQFYKELADKANEVGEAKAVGEHISEELNKPSDGYDRRMFYREWNAVKRVALT